MNARVHGSPTDSTKTLNCGTCGVRDVCRDPRKARGYACTFYVGDAYDAKQDASSQAFLDLMRDLVRKESVLTDPYAIDDRDAPEAPNFFRWCVGKQFLRVQPFPYPKQLQLGMKLFGDACPYCSDADWYADIPFDCEVREIPKRLVLREFGVCPRCKRSLLDGIRDGREGDVNTLFGVLGQRSGKCLVGDTLINTKRGVIPICDVVVGDHVVVQGVAHPVTAAIKTRKKRVRQLITEDGYSITGTPDHLLKSPIGWTELSAAKWVLISAEKVSRPSMSEWRKKIVRKHPGVVTSAEHLAELPDEVARELVRQSVASYAAADKGVVVTFNNAPWMQQALLQWNIFCDGVSLDGRSLVLMPPNSTKFFKVFGVFSGFVARHVWNNRGDADPPSEAACNEIADAFRKQQIKDLGLVTKGLLERLNEVYNAATSKSLSRADAARGARLLRQIPVLPRMGLFRTELIHMLDSVANGTSRWSKVKTTRAVARKADVYDIEVPGVARFVANGIVAHNSTGMGLIISYHTHKLLKLKNPSAFYKIKAGTILHNNIIGIQFGLAKSNVFDPLLATMSESPWFRNYDAIMEDAAKKRGEEDFVRVKETYVFYRPAGLWLAPSSPSRRSLRGKTRSGFTVDELGHFSGDEKKVNISGLEVWRALTRSLNTIRPAVNRLRRRGVINVPVGLAVGISSPWDVADPIMTLVNGAIRNKLRSTYSVILPTWEANPDITFEDLAADFAENSVAAWRDLGCRPPYSASAFVTSIDPYVEVVQKYRPFASQQTYLARGARGVRRFVSVKLTWRSEETSIPKLLALDAGRHNNSFGACVCHIDSRGRVAYDLFLEAHPQPDMPVGYSQIYEDALLKIVDKLNIVAVVSDRWQNYKITDDLESDRKLLVKEIRLKYGNFGSWRDDLLRGYMTMPRPECSSKEILNIDKPEVNAFDDKPTAQFIRQSLRVVDIPGKTVDKPAVGNDDVWRSGVLAHAATRDEEIAALLAWGDAKRKSSGAVVAISTGSRPSAPRSSPVAVLPRVF